MSASWARRAVGRCGRRPATGAPCAISAHYSPWLGDLRSELTLLGRYILTVLDEETQLLKMAARTPSDRSARLNSTYAALFEGLYAELADWVKGWVPGISKQDAATIGAVGVNALLGKPATSTLFQASGADIPDEQYIAEWTAMLANRIETLR